MALDDLRAYLSVLEAEKEIHTISVPVDPHLEAAEIHRRVIAEGGPALKFTNIKGAAYPLVTNLFGTKRRIDLAFGPKPELFMRRIAHLPRSMMPPSLSNLWKERSLFKDLLSVGLSRTSRSPVSEVQESPPQLSRLPLLTTWEEDGGAFITLPLVYTEHPEGLGSNLGMYRLQRFDDATTGFHCQIGKGAGYHLAAARALGKKLPVNVYVGGPPALILSAIAPLPENVPELLLASLVMGKNLKLGANPFGTLPIVANAEFAIIGEVDPHESRPEGPFGDHYGYYSLKHDYPVFRVKGVLRRKNPICTATIVGKPRQEDFYLGDYLQSLLSPLFPIVMPAVKSLWSYGETGYHSLASAVVKQRYKREALANAFRILGEGQLTLTKFLFVTDQPIDVRDFTRTLECVLERANFNTDLYIFSNTAMDTLDYAGPKVNEGSKGVLLGVGEPIRTLPRDFKGELPVGIKRAIPYCGGCVVVQGPSYSEEKTLASRLAHHPSFREWPLVVLVDDARFSTSSTSNFLWSTFTRFEPAADIIPRSTSVIRNHLRFEHPIVIDARMKPWYPAELAVDEKTRELVSKRWREYF